MAAISLPQRSSALAFKKVFIFVYVGRYLKWCVQVNLN